MNEPNLALRQRIAAELLGDIDESGFCTCPGAERHTGRTAPKDCRITLEGAPTVFCLHSSCRADVEEANHQLRSRIGKAEAGGRIEPIQPEERAARERRAREKAAQEASERAQKEQAAAILPRILEGWAWDTPAMWQDSPGSLLWEDKPEWQTFLAGLYRPDDALWIGDTFDTGEPEHARHFRTVRDWLNVERPPGPLICPATFAAGAFSRCEASIESRFYVVLEGDAVLPEIAAKAARGEPLSEPEKYSNQAACGAVINWLRHNTALELRAVVDSGSKSLHGWFDCPDPGELDELKRLIPSLGFDPATLRPAQPVRLPGVMRPGARRWQRLLFLNPNPRNII